MRHFANVLSLLLLMTLRKDLHISAEEQQLSIQTNEPVCELQCPGLIPPEPPCNCPADKPKKEVKPKTPKKEGNPTVKPEQKDLQTSTKEEQLSMQTNQPPVCQMLCPGFVLPEPPCDCPGDKPKKKEKATTKPKKPKNKGKSTVKPKKPKKKGKATVKPKKDLQISTKDDQLPIDTEEIVCKKLCDDGTPPKPPCNCPGEKPQKEGKSTVKPKKPKKKGKATTKPKKPKKEKKKTVKPKKPKKEKKATVKPKKPKKEGKPTVKPEDMQKDLQISTKEEQLSIQTNEPPVCDKLCDDGSSPKPPCNCPGDDMQKDLQTSTKEEQLSIQTNEPVCDKLCEDGSPPQPPCICPGDKPKKGEKVTVKSKTPKKAGKVTVKPKSGKSFGKKRKVKRHVAKGSGDYVPDKWFSYEEVDLLKGQGNLFQMY